MTRTTLNPVKWRNNTINVYTFSCVIQHDRRNMSQLVTGEQVQYNTGISNTCLHKK